MPTAQRRVDRGSLIGSAIVQEIGREIREARIAAGLSQRHLGAAVGLSHMHVSRIERGRVRRASVLVLARLLSVVGLRLSARAYPDGPPVRDAGQGRLLNRFRGQLAPSVRMRTEVPLRTRTPDQRAWDAEVIGAGWSFVLDAEVRLRDIQAVDRRVALKAADDNRDVVVLLVAESRANSAALREFLPLLRDRYPLTTGQILAAMRRGDPLPASGICVL